MDEERKEEEKPIEEGPSEKEVSGLEEGLGEEASGEAEISAEKKEEPSKGSSEEWIQALEEESEEAPPPKKSSWGTWILILGIILGLLGLGAGSLLLWRWWHAPSPTASIPEKSSVSTEQKTSPLGPPIKPALKYSLILKHFLIPLQSEGGAPVFVKATVILYFSSSREVLLAQKLETPFRSLIFDTLKGLPFYYWRSKEGVEKVRQVLLEVLKKKAPEGLVPKEVEVKGYILK